MWKEVKNWFKYHIDYRIVGEYYEQIGEGRYPKKYIRKYYWKRNHPKRKNQNKKKGD